MKSFILTTFSPLVTSSQRRILRAYSTYVFPLERDTKFYTNIEEQLDI
jgi:hypothetical protein